MRQSRIDFHIPPKQATRPVQALSRDVEEKSRFNSVRAGRYRLRGPLWRAMTANSFVVFEGPA
jgi:hypothetical protein